MISSRVTLRAELDASKDAQIISNIPLGGPAAIPGGDGLLRCPVDTVTTHQAGGLLNVVTAPSSSLGRPSAMRVTAVVAAALQRWPLLFVNTVPPSCPNSYATCRTSAHVLRTVWPTTTAAGRFCTALIMPNGGLRHEQPRWSAWYHTVGIGRNSSKKTVMCAYGHLLA